MSTVPAYTFQCMDDFRCIQGKCENTCCADWDIYISDEEKTRFKNVYPEVYKIIASDGNDSYMPLKSDSSCAFLDEGLCKIHAEHGEEALTEGCSKFPKVYKRVNTVEVGVITYACPESTRIMLFSADPFKLTRSDKAPTASSEKSFDPRDLKPQDVESLLNFFIDSFLTQGDDIEHCLIIFVESMANLKHKPLTQWADNIKDIFAESSQRNYSRQASSADNVDEFLSLVEHFLTTKGYTFKDATNSVIRQEIRNIRGGATPGLWLEGINHGRLDGLLRRLLASSITTLGLPFDGLTQQGAIDSDRVSDWADKIVFRFVVLRFLLLCVLKNNNNDIDDASVVDIVHRYYRAAFHTPFSELETTYICRGQDQLLREISFLGETDQLEPLAMYRAG